MSEITVQTYDGQGNLIATRTETLSTEQVNERAIRGRLDSALAANVAITSRMQAIIDDPNITSGEVATYLRTIAADVRALARECSGLIRLTQRLLGDASDT